MAATADKAHENIIWRMETISPGNTAPGRKFRYVDARDIDEAATSGAVRTFQAEWSGSEADAGTTDITGREAIHTTLVDVNYPTGIDGYGSRKLHAIMLMDLHDIKKQLRDSRLWAGYDANHSATDIGLWGRDVVRAERLVSEGFTTLRLTVQSQINEEE